MRSRIGKENLGEFARSQVAAARSDPRLGRKRGAMVADFWAGMEEAERVRMLGIFGLHELSQALEREEQRLGVTRDSQDLTAEAERCLQAAWERAEMARIEIENGHPHLNAQALLSMNSALDAMVEEFVPALVDIGVRGLGDRLMERATRQEPEAAAQLTEEMREMLTDTVRELLSERVAPKVKRLHGSGAARYEAVLSQVGLRAPDDRPIPVDLDEALAELGALRDVLVHRAGRVDDQALKQAPSLRYQDGDLVRVSADDYRTYSAAIRCYASEIVFRSIRSWAGVSDDDGPDLANWRNYRLINV
jgi:hypothetical protein